MALVFIAILLSIIPFLGFWALHSHKTFNYEQSVREASRYGKEISGPAPTYPTTLAGIVSAALVFLFVLSESYVIVPAGHIGVQVTFGTVNQTTLPEGLHFVNPFSGIKNVEVRLVSTNLKGASTGTKDLQQVHTDIVLNYRLDGTKAAHIYKEFGLDLQDRVILPILNESFKAVTAHYTSEELITKRDQVSQQIREELNGKLMKYSVTVGDISLVNFGFSAEYQKAIEAKVTATQSKLKAEQDLARIEVEAKQEIAKAEGRAKAIQIETQAINSQGGASYVQLKAIEKWNGKLPETMAGSSTPFINLK